MKQLRKQVEICCDFCNKTFLKDESELKRNSKLNRKNYCSRSCLGHVNKLHIPFNNDSSRLIASNRKDEFTGFREHLRRIKYRNKEVNLSLQDLKDVFDSQNGICVYSKVKLEFVPRTGKSNPIYTISLDRKNSDVGYTKNNIQFISISMNHLKNDMKEQQMQEILSIIKNITNE